MTSSSRHALISDAIFHRLKRDGLSNNPDIFVQLRESKNIVLPLLPFLAPPSIVVPTKSTFPTEDAVGRLIESFFDHLELPTECAIVGLIYLDRIRVFSALHKASWRLVVTAAFMLAAKMWEDSPRRWVVEFSNVTNLSETKLVLAEEKFCTTLDFNLHVDAEDYRQYTLGLRMKERPSFTRMPTHLV
jgi:hypothetical protein